MRSFFSYDRFEGYSKTVMQEVKPKLHTIRQDKKNRWKAGTDIHFVINNRSKDRYQFAPIIKCVSTQRIAIINTGKHPHGDYHKCMEVLVEQDSENTRFGSCHFDKDGDIIYCSEWVEDLAINDGFESVKDFFSWFRTDFHGKIIHWTDLKY
ncbi:MAG: hypothetical protein WCD31_14515 [Gillisia sp.]